MNSVGQTIREEPETSTVIIAIDYCEESEYAARWYISKLHKEGNRVCFVHCIDLPEISPSQARSVHMTPSSFTQLWKDEEAKTKALNEKIKAILKENGIKGILRTATGKPTETLVKVAEEEKACVIVIGPREMGKMKRAVVGSFTEYVMRNAHCPVVVCRHPDDIEKQRSRQKNRVSAADSEDAPLSPKDGEAAENGASARRGKFSSDKSFSFKFSRSTSKDEE